MTDHRKDIDTEFVKRIIEGMNEGHSWPSLKEMRENPTLRNLLRDENEINYLTGKFFKAIKSKIKLKCLAPTTPPCDKKSIRSHSIQRSNALSLLADNTNHIIMLKPAPTSEERPKSKAIRVGINNASIFEALCSKHDMEIFHEIDNKPIDTTNQKQLFLLSYRSIMKEYYSKKTQLEVTKQIAKTIYEDNDSTQEVQLVGVINAYDCYIGAFYLEKLKSIYDHAFNCNEYDKYFHFIVKQTKLFPFSAASLFTPFFDLNGNEIAKVRRDQPVPAMSIDVVPNIDKTTTVFCIPKHFLKQLYTLIQQIEDSETEYQLTQTIWEVALRYCETLVISPLFWQSLEKKHQKAIELFFDLTIYKWAPFLEEHKLF